jgi:hypothetical protein
LDHVISYYEIAIFVSRFGAFISRRTEIFTPWVCNCVISELRFFAVLEPCGLRVFVPLKPAIRCGSSIQCILVGKT